MARWNQKHHWQLQQLKKAQQSQSEKQPETEKPPAPIVSTEPIVGLRVWNITKQGGMPYLRSTFKSEFVWPYRKPLEQDIVSNHGIHAIKPTSKGASWADPLAIGESYTIESLIGAYSAEVMGEVYLWGRVEEHDYGYLAQFAYPKRLWVSPQMDVLTFMQLEDEYGVPCDTHEALAKHPSAQTVQSWAQNILNTPYVQYQPLSAAGMATQQAYQQLQASGAFPQGLLGAANYYKPYGL